VTEDPVFGVVCSDLTVQSVFDKVKWTDLVGRVEGLCAGYDTTEDWDAVFVVGIGAMQELGVREWADFAWVSTFELGSSALKRLTPSSCCENP
jgi:hypothetical protein